MFTYFLSYLKFVFLTSETRSLLLPEVVWLDYVRRVDEVGEVLLQDLEDWLYRRPGRTTHVYHNRERDVPHVIAERKKKEERLLNSI